MERHPPGRNWSQYDQLDGLSLGPEKIYDELACYSHGCSGQVAVFEVK